MNTTATTNPVQPRNPRPEPQRSERVDRRGDTLPCKEGMYTPRFTLDDWDRARSRGWWVR